MLSKKQLTTLIGIALSGLATTTFADDAAPAKAADATMEKCYGIVKKGMNDCAGITHSCAAQTSRDSAKDSWI
jgi:uncharacterized membrane protein